VDLQNGAVDTTGVALRNEPGSDRSRRYPLLDAAFLDDPYPSYRQLREHDPVYMDRRFLGWIISRYDDVQAVLRDPTVSSRRPLADEPIPRSLEPIADELRELRRFQAHWLLYLDPPDHTRLRALLGTAFTPERAEHLRPRIQDLVDELLTDAPAGELDVMRDLARPLPVLVIAELLGLPAEDRGLFRAWSDHIAGGMLLQGGPDAVARLRAAHHCQLELIAYFRELIGRRQQEPRDDLLSALLAAQGAGAIASSDELLATCVLLLFAGHETTTNLIGNGVLALLEHPDQLERLRRDPELLPTAVEELLRFDSPVQATGRRATREMRLGNQVIGPNEFLIVLLGSANRDPERFERPDALDVGRLANRHLAFAQGPHFCLGAPLARLEGQLAIGALAQRLHGLRLAGETRRRRHFYLRGLDELPVAFQSS
jgi:cytochrome P450